MRALGVCAAGLLFAVQVFAATQIDNAALNNEKDGRNWPAYGRTFSEAHYSPLT